MDCAGPIRSSGRSVWPITHAPRIGPDSRLTRAAKRYLFDHRFGVVADLVDAFRTHLDGHLVGGTADALGAAHALGIIHRDVKPENMLIGQHQEVLLSDFGIATIAHSTSSLNVSAEGTSGTLAYMAPEQVEGADTDARTAAALRDVMAGTTCTIGRARCNNHT